MELGAKERGRATRLLAELIATAGLVDPTSRFQRLQKLGPVVESDLGVLVVGHDAALMVLRDTRLVADPAAAFANIGISDWRTHPLTELLGESLFFDKGASHTAVRRVVAHFFTPSAIEKLRVQITEIVEARLEETVSLLASHGSVDLVSSFARPVPIEVACRTLGLDLADAPRLAELLLQAQLGSAALDLDPDDLARLADVGRELGEYLGRKLDACAGTAIQVSERTILEEIAAGCGEGRLTKSQGRSLAFVLLGAGFETTSNLIANAARLLLDGAVSHTIDTNQLIERALSIHPPVQLTARGVDGSEPIELCGVTVHPGTPILVLIGAATHQHATREVASETTLAFGSGVHHCIGHHLARIQAGIALDALVPFLKSVDPVGPAKWRSVFAFRSLESLVVSNTPTNRPSATDQSRVKKLQRKRRRRFTGMLRGIGLSAVGHKIRRLGTKGVRRMELDTAASARQATKAVETFGEMRGVMMKYGQLFSYAAPALDPAAKAVMASLQDNVDPMAPGTAERVVESELGRPLTRVFASFDATPIAAASIGQVHRASLPDGNQVAVKVQYEGIAEAVAADLAEVARTNKLLSRFVLRNMDPGPLSQELADRINEEIDYTIEAENQRLFSRRYASHPFIRIPTVIDSLCSTKVLTTQWMDGLRWKEFVAQASQSQKDRIGEMLVRFVFAGVRRYGSFQADAHPGNFIVAPDASWLGVLDFGLIKSFTPAAYEAARLVADAVYGVTDRTALSAAEAVGYFKPGHSVSAQRFDEYVAPIRESFGSSGMMTHEIYERAVRAAYDPRAGFSDVTRQANAPAETVLQDRLAFGTMALLAELNATCDWIGIIRQYGGDGGPTTELGQIEEKWFTTRRR
jgi:predicted unusual protein kinase regulating ubiquinone biosynthesis (AarF/ABC1/UbiB family)/cytochrome P450